LGKETNGEVKYFKIFFLNPEIDNFLFFCQAKVSEKAGQSLADPENYENLFPNFQNSLRAQKALTKERRQRLPAEQYRKVAVSFIF